MLLYLSGNIYVRKIKNVFFFLQNHTINSGIKFVVLQLLSEEIMGNKVNQIIETLSLILITHLFIKSVLNYNNTLILINQRKRNFFIKYFSFFYIEHY